jgi:hypothetical protein
MVGGRSQRSPTERSYRNGEDHRAEGARHDLRPLRAERQEALDSLDGLKREGRPRDGRRRGRLRRRKVNIEQMGETIEEVGYTLRS